MRPIGFNDIKHIDSCSGFTLIEVMIAMVIFSLGILSIYAMQVTAINTNAKAKVVTQGVTCAMDRVEKLMMLPYEDSDLTAGEHSVAAGSFTQATDGIDNNNDGQIDEAGENGPIDISWTIQDDSPELNTKSIAVTVTHNIPLRKNKHVTLNFIKAVY